MSPEQKILLLLIRSRRSGEMIVRDMKNNPKCHYDPIGFIDDNLYKKLRVAVPSDVPSVEELRKHISTLEEIVSRHAADEVIPALQKIVPNFRRS